MGAAAKDAESNVSRMVSNVVHVFGIELFTCAKRSLVNLNAG
jgi:hypothetical protein